VTADHRPGRRPAARRPLPGPRERHFECGSRRVAHGRYEAFHRFGVLLRRRPDAAEALAVLLHRLRSQLDFNLAAAADDAEPNDFAGPTPHRPYHLFPDPNL